MHLVDMRHPMWVCCSHGPVRWATSPMPRALHAANDALPVGMPLQQAPSLHPRRMIHSRGVQNTYKSLIQAPSPHIPPVCRLTATSSPHLLLHSLQARWPAIGASLVDVLLEARSMAPSARSTMPMGLAAALTVPLVSSQTSRARCVQDPLVCS